MKLTIENTTKIVELDGVPARVWEGHSESGIPVHCYVVRVGVAEDQDRAQFERELTETRPPSPAVEAIPLRLIL